MTANKAPQLPLHAVQRADLAVEQQYDVPAGARLVCLPEHDAALEAFPEVLDRRKVGAVTGPLGTGKTILTAALIRRALQHNPELSVTSLTFELADTPRRAFEQVYRAITGQAARGSRTDIQEELLPRLAERQRLLVLDEAHLSGSVTLTQFVSLMRKPGANWSLLLVGSDLGGVLDRGHYVGSRVFKPTHLQPLLEADLRPYLCRFHPM